ncbi:alpha/beta hydrolase [Echinimonas agarilytica]|uniref:Alpha/beta hydrolase n=1 Tax=Echinimonas agarilytica TaxID=1215918 RepID=A0AA41W7M0_9GAMM|nr:alpha/beta hydrolase [Echinimonas agarilytica]MCM2680742.1 alpha/beta hydrolase [Echinimonas agarilytica]
MRQIMLLLILAMLSSHSNAQNYVKEEIKIWQQGTVPLNKPNIELTEQLDEEDKRFTQISEPIIYLYRKANADKPGPALLYAPGGGYAKIAIGKRRGAEWAELFLDMGFTAVAVLKYRLPDGRIVEQPHNVPLIDAQQALATLHRNAEQWKIERSKIGVKGASAGGHLIASLNNLTEDILAPGVKPEELKQAFSILRVPVITFNPPYRHKGSYKRLLGDLSNNQDLLDYFSMENQVTSSTPPTFLVYATEDKSVPYENSEIYVSALKKNGVDFKAVELKKVGHGFGLNRSRVDKDWVPELKIWVSSVLADKQ